MSFISVVGAFLITFALISYGVGSISIQRFSQISKEVLWFLSMGVVLNISAIILLIENRDPRFERGIKILLAIGDGSHRAKPRRLCLRRGPYGCP